MMTLVKPLTYNTESVLYSLALESSTLFYVNLWFFRSHRQLSFQILVFSWIYILHSQLSTLQLRYTLCARIVNDLLRVNWNVVLIVLELTDCGAHVTRFSPLIRGIITVIRRSRRERGVSLSDSCKEPEKKLNSSKIQWNPTRPTPSKFKTQPFQFVAQLNPNESHINGNV